MRLASPQPAVAVFGSADPCEGDEAYELARAVGGQLASLGYTLVNGGYGGTMEASARGAVEAGGWVVGVTCRAWSSAPNRYMNETVDTPDLFGRVRKLIELGTGGYVVLPGATGTLVELAMVWELVCKRFLPEVPIVCVGQFYQPLMEMMAQQRPRCGGLVAVVRTADELCRHFPDCRAH